MKGILSLFVLLLWALISNAQSDSFSYKIYDDNDNIKRTIEDVKFRDSSKIIFSIQPIELFGDLDILWLERNRFYIDSSEEYKTPSLGFLDRYKKSLRKDSIYSWHFNNLEIDISPSLHPIKGYQESVDCNIDSANIEYENISIGKMTTFISNFKDFLSNTDIDEYHMLRPENVALLSDKKSRINKLRIYGGDSTKELTLNSINAGNIYIYHPRIADNEIKFIFCTLPDTFFLSDIKFINAKANLDLTTLKLKKGKSKCYILIKNTNIANIDFNYRDFKLIWDNTFTEEDKHKIYLQLLEKFKKEGQIQSYDSLSAEYEQFKYFLLPENEKYKIKFWNNIKKVGNFYLSNMLFWTLSLLVIFIIVNYRKRIKGIRLYEVLNTDVYKLQNLNLDKLVDDKDSKGWNRKHFFYSAVYTSLIFFSINMKFDNLYFHKKYLLVWFLMIYIVGLLNLFLIGHLLFK